MDKPKYFQTALSNFATDVACGGAVRHLVDIGYTLDQICDRLDYPTPRAKVQKIMMEYLYESRILLREEPSMEIFVERAQFIQEQDAFGRRTLRKIGGDYDSQWRATKASNLTSLSEKRKSAQLQDILWKESVYDRKRDGKLTELLYRKCEESGEVFGYVSCRFAFLNYDQISQNTQKEKKTADEESIDCLNNRQREYLRGIRWEQPVLYHRLDQRMREIVGKLYEAGVYSGTCYFVADREKLVI